MKTATTHGWLWLALAAILLATGKNPNTFVICSVIWFAASHIIQETKP